MGLWMAAALVVGDMVGSGLFLLPATLAGTPAPFDAGRLFTGAGAVLLARCSPSSGALRTRAARTRTPSARSATRRLQNGWGDWIAGWAGNGPSRSRRGYLTVFWPEVGDNNLLRALVGIGLIWLLAFTSILGARQSGIVQLATTVLKFVPLASSGSSACSSSTGATTSRSRPTARA